ncbi:hypothetical protein AOQ84DRAFT_199228 [Glonium stellatum]|uniref:Phenol 2-monooxygenase n=1 Tax=Glonium stellatum TaxID=574774 RepID=A0A8E2F652_9PEZI|nr:hypothetical protein AOQ84DRAFT_199228 [Glonium stellatum]
MPGVVVPESNCDVLIVGAGPAGMMMAAWMARCGINARIIDKRGTKIFNGQADGLQCRSLEIFDSFGFADRAWKESNHMLEMCMWNPGLDGVIRRSDRLPDTIPGISRFTQIVLHQGRIERFFLDHLKKYSKIEVERGVLPESLEIDTSKVEDNFAYPITVKLRHLTDEEATPEQSKASKVEDGLFRSNLAADDTDDLIRKSRGKEGTAEIVRAKYMVGCDGAHSWTRRQLGFEMEGEATDYIWGVLDIIPITDFPDIRMRCAIHSAESGSMMVIPRENKLVRLYIQLTEITPDATGRADRSKITPETILKAAQKIISPYKISYEYCDWWTAYQIGQRVGTQFDAHTRVFLAGDAVHTHSPKAGQGMNVSMQDAYNLGWKIGLVVKGIVQRSVLKTYQSERRRVAQDLIEFDHRFSRLFSGRPAKDVMDESGVSMAEFKEAFVKGNMFASGLSVDYGASMLVAKQGSSAEQGDGTDVSTAHNSLTGKQVVGKQELSTNIKLGMRMPSFKVLNQSDARPWHLQELLKSDSRFRIILFAGNVTSATQKTRIKNFCVKLDAQGSFLRRFTPASCPIDSVIEILTLHSAKRCDVEILRDFPELLHPFDKQVGWDYNKIYVDDESYHEGDNHAYENYGVDKERGCVVVLRPDQYVGYIGDFEDVEDLETYFDGVLVKATKS